MNYDNIHKLGTKNVHNCLDAHYKGVKINAIVFINHIKLGIIQK